MATPSQRRDLKFTQLGDIVQDAEALHATGYVKMGKWDLSQICGHLSDWIRYPVEGFPRAPLPFRVIFWMVRKTVGPSQFRRTLERGTLPAGAPTLRETVPAPAGDETEAIEKLRQALAAFEAHQGAFHPSPLFGEMNRDQLTQLHMIHSAHHLSFLKPKDEVSTSDNET